MSRDQDVYAQLDRIRACDEIKQYDVVDVFHEPPSEAWSLNGSAFGSMVTRLHAGEAEAVFIDALEFLPASDVLDEEVWVTYLHQHGWRLIAVSQPALGNDDAKRTLIRRFHVRLTSYSSALFSLKMRGIRMAARKQTGHTEGAKRYGMLAGEDKTLKRIQELRSQGLGYAPIAAILNSEGVQPRRGKQWYPTTIANILDARRSAQARKSRKNK